MEDVKRVEAYGLISDLRAFACEQSTGFAAGRQHGYEVHKSFYHDDPVPAILADKVSPEMCKSTYSYEAFRVPGARTKPGYTFALSAALERTLPTIPRHILRFLPDDILLDFGEFEDIEEGALAEEARVELEASTYELRLITVSHFYEITYAGTTIYEASDDDILFAEEGYFTDIPAVESVDEADKLYIPEAIEHERIDGPDNVSLNTDYWAIVDPHGIGGTRQIASYQSAAARMRTIVQALRTGNVIY